MTDDGTYKYYYDCENCLTYVNDVNDALVASYKYDHLGRLTSADWGSSYAKFDDTYDANTYNISTMRYDHRTNDPCTEFSYDNLDRLTVAEYGIEDNNEAFTMDYLGNRSNVNVRDGAA